jgi:hypothetical protein
MLTVRPEEKGERSSRHRSRSEVLKGVHQSLLGRLDLDSTQEKAVLQILEKSRKRLEDAEVKRGRLWRQVGEETFAEIRPILRPAQQEKLDEFLSELRQTKRKRYGGKAKAGKEKPHSGESDQ